VSVGGLDGELEVVAGVHGLEGTCSDGPFGEAVGEVLGRGAGVDLEGWAEDQGSHGVGSLLGAGSRHSASGNRGGEEGTA